jgi:hypothetical protein
MKPPCGLWDSDVDQLPGLALYAEKIGEYDDDAEKLLSYCVGPTAGELAHELVVGLASPMTEPWGLILVR